jgi:endonuclease/exonuclease/phosphatase family metal-dependent hydrolase
MAVRIRVLTVNIWNNQGDPRRQRVLNREIKRLNPDLVALQEVIQTPTESQLSVLLEGLDLHSTHQADVLPNQPAHSDRYGGTAVATRWPHRLVEVLELRTNEAQDVPWCTLATKVTIPSAGEVLFIGTTLSWRLNTEATRERQVVALTDLDARHRTSLPTIIAGDFNASPEAACIRYMCGLQSIGGRSVKYHDAWAVACEGSGYTWAVDNPNARLEMDRIVRQPNYRRRLDYIFIGSWDAHPNSHCRIVGASLAFDKPTEGMWLSDHFGVMADLEISGWAEA